MTYDDGILKIYRVEDISENGNKPIVKPVYKLSSYFGFEDVGIKRYFAALENKRMIESVVAIELNKNVFANDLVELEDASVFTIVMVQHPLNKDGIRFTRLSLERVDENADIEIKKG